MTYFNIPPQNSSGLVDPMTNRGDIITRDSSNTTARLAIGTSGQVLTSDGTDASWQASAAGFVDPMTTRGDIIFRDGANATTRLPIGAANSFLSSDGNDLGYKLETAINHNTLTNYVANQHIDWTNASANFLTTGTVDGGIDNANFEVITASTLQGR